MVTLPRKLQAQSTCGHQSYQLLLLYGNKKPKFLLSLVGPKAFTVSFSNRLLPGQGK